MTQEKEYIAMGFKLMPSGRINHHWWYCRKFIKGSVRDKTWVWEDHRKKEIGHGHHSCCQSRKAYCHKVGCINRKDANDLSDLK